MPNTPSGRVTDKKKKDEENPANSFVLGDLLGALNYNFASYGDSGTIPEPSSAQIAAFKKAVGDMIAASAADDDDMVSKEEGITPKAVRRMAEMLAKDSSEEEQKLLLAIAEVCSDSPSFDVLDALPYRAQQHFFGWISGIFLLPEA